MLSKTSVGFELVVFENLVRSRLMREFRESTAIVVKVIRLIAGDRQLDVNQQTGDVSFVLLLRVMNLPHGEMSAAIVHALFHGSDNCGGTLFIVARFRIGRNHFDPFQAIDIHFDVDTQINTREML